MQPEKGVKFGQMILASEDGKVTKISPVIVPRTAQSEAASERYHKRKLEEWDKEHPGEPWSDRRKIKKKKEETASQKKGKEKSSENAGLGSSEPGPSSSRTGMSNSDSPLSSSRRVTRSGLPFAATIHDQASTGTIQNPTTLVESSETQAAKSLDPSCDEDESSSSSHNSLFHSPSPDIKKDEENLTSLGTKRPSRLLSPPLRPFLISPPSSKELPGNAEKSGILYPRLRDSAREDSSGEGARSSSISARKQQVSLDSLLLAIEFEPETDDEGLLKPESKLQHLASPVSNASSATIFTSSEHSSKRKLGSSPTSSMKPPLLSDVTIPSKRQKTASKDTSWSPVKKHPTLWLPDGNAIIQLEETQFNLHCSRLTNASPLFSGLFTQGSADEGRPTIVISQQRENGIVYILDSKKVSLKDVEVMFEIFEDGLRYSHQDPPFTIVASVLRAAAALDFPALRKWADKYFQDIWKPSVKKRTGINAEDTLTFVTPTTNPHVVESLDLARQLQDITITKLALYDLCRIGVLPEDVSQNDRTTVTTVRQELRRTWARLAASPSFSFSCSSTTASRVKDEHTHVPCITDTPASAVVKYVEAVHTSGMYDKFVFDPICGLQALIDMTDVWRSHAYCSACILARRGEWQHNKQEVWRQLDDWFGLHVVSA